MCLPTPLAAVAAYILVETRKTVEPAYEHTLLNELQQICAAVPHDQLAISVGHCDRVRASRRVLPTHLANPHEDIVQQPVCIRERVPVDVAVRYHLCNGDANHHRFVQPKEPGLLVSVANTVCSRVRRTINWIHLPVPRRSNDDTYYMPLGKLKRAPEADLYLGKLHVTRGLDRARNRMRAATKAVNDFDISTECGFGRRRADTIAPLLRLHRTAAETSSTFR